MQYIHMICAKIIFENLISLETETLHVLFRTLLELYSNPVENNPQRINTENIDTPYNTLRPSLSYPPLLPFSFYHTIPLPSLARGW